MRRVAALVAPLAAVALLLGSGGVADANSTTTLPDPAWGLNQITGGTAPRSTGQGVNAYIIDTGLNVSDPDFGGRAKIVHDVYNGTGADCWQSGDYMMNGQLVHGGQFHGTGVASVLGGNRYGVAKQVNLLGVRAWDCSGDAPSSAKFVEAINWVIDDQKKHPQIPAVATITSNWMAQGYWNPNGENNIRAAVDNLAANNIFVAVSAGNIHYEDWPTGSLQYNWVAYAASNLPANAAQALVVMASDQDNQAVLSMNYPICTYDSTLAHSWSTPTRGDIYAPATDIGMSNGDGTYGQHCGTSFAAPMAAGVAALYKATYGDAPSATVKSWILAHATQNAISNNPSSATPNRLLSTGGL